MRSSTRGERCPVLALENVARVSDEFRRVIATRFGAALLPFALVLVKALVAIVLWACWKERASRLA